MKTGKEPHAVGAALCEYETAQGLRWRLLRWFRLIHRRLRQEKLALFFNAMQPVPSETLLDVGGTTGFAGEYEGLYCSFGRVIVLNLDPRHEPGQRCVFVRGDARFLPFPDRSVDLVFSNAVIEHVGAWEDQMAMAKEIQRVARRGYFIATPNRYFPIDPHTYLPFFHLLSSRTRWYLVRSLLYPHLKGDKSFSEFRMLSRRDLARLFPQATICSKGGHTSLIAVWSAAGSGLL